MSENLIIREFDGNVYKHAIHISSAVTKNIVNISSPLIISVTIWENKNLCNRFLSEYGSNRSGLDLDYHVCNCEEGDGTNIIENVYGSLFELGLEMSTLHRTKDSILIKINPILMSEQILLLVDRINTFLLFPSKNKNNRTINIDYIIEYILNSLYINIFNDIHEFDIIISNDKRRKTLSSADIAISINKDLSTNTFKVCEVICNQLNTLFDEFIEFKHNSDDIKYVDDIIHVTVKKEREV